MNLGPSSNNRAQPNGTTGSEQQQYGTHHRLTPQEAALRGASLAFQKQQHQAQEGGHTHKTGVVGGAGNNGGGGGIIISRQTTGASVAGGGGGRISRQPTGSSVRSSQQQRDYADEAADRERERERKALFLSSSSAATTPDQAMSQQLLLPLPLGARPSPAPAEGRSASFIAATLAARRSVSPGTAGAAADGGGVVRRSPLREPVDRRRGSAASGLLDELTDTTSLAPATSLISLFEGQRETDEIVKGSPERLGKRKPKLRSPRPRTRLEKTEDGGLLDRGSVESSSDFELRAPRHQRGLLGTDDLAISSIDSSPKSKPSPKPKPKPKPEVDTDTVKISSNRPFAGKPKPVSPGSETGLEKEDVTRGRRNFEPESTSRPSPKPKPRVVTRPETPPPPVFRRADTEIVSPKPRRPKTKPRLEAPVPSSEPNEHLDMTIKKGAKAKPKVPPKVMERSPKGIPPATQGEHQATRRPSLPSKSPVVAVKSRPPAPKQSSGLSERLPPQLRRQSIRRQSVISIHDGQEESKLRIDQDAKDARPTTSDSRSSNDSFVSASSVPIQDDADSLLTIEAPSSRSMTPKGRTSRPASTRPLTPLPIRQSVTGSSLLSVDSLSNAIMAGSLASARHTPSSLNDGRTPPPLPPSRRKGGTSSKHKPPSRRPSPHRMKHTLRQPKAHSDDEEARRPHHKKGLNHKKHAHHEGSRHRWREEITEREKKRYEGVWASNRGALLVTAAPAAAAQQPACADPPRPPLRTESYEECAEHVANVIVRDLWSRSRLPAPELAEVWDLVYGHGRAPGRVLHGALNKQEFVVGMWLIDQRLRGRKIPPRVTESVWDSAKGLRVLNPDRGHGHGQGHRGKEKGKGKGKEW